MGRRTSPWLAALIALLCATARAAAAAPFQEYQIKAVYLLNFARFVDWPAAALPAARQPMSICVVGTNPFGEYLPDAIRDERVEGHPLAWRELRRGESLAGCNIAYLSRSEDGHIDAVLTQAAQQHVLTVSDIPGFVSQGGALGFETHDNHVRVQVNTTAARAAGLTISSKLVRIATVVAP